MFRIFKLNNTTKRIASDCINFLNGNVCLNACGHDVSFTYNNVEYFMKGCTDVQYNLREAEDAAKFSYENGQKLSVIYPNIDGYVSIATQVTDSTICHEWVEIA